MTLKPTSLGGSFLIKLPQAADPRGTFVKTFHESTLIEHGIYFTLRESYFSFSKKDVIRGMHFQLPPWQHSKLVFCPKGAIIDVIVDLRRSSPTYGKFEAHELSAQNHSAIYIPEGFAHGFKSLTDDTLTYYLVSSEHNKQCDAGIRYDTIGFDWDVKDPIISARDLSFGSLQDFDSPF
jgi:dTDP-4-dehydrorhamnose 3,5-epimerase/CDP-3, 6-dideoxy-D-glycero-D-glycero-4-hexulose-5-epimerase